MKNIPFQILKVFDSLLGRFSLRTKFIIGIVGLSFVSVTALALYNYLYTRTQLTETVTANLKNVASVQAHEIGDLLTLQVSQLQSLGGSKTIQDLVLACNLARCGDPQTQTDLNSLEAEWQAANAARVDNPLVKSVINNPAAIELSAFRESFPDNVEVIVTNKYGLNLAATQRTSRYSYREEAWWRTAYNNGSGAIYIGEPELLASIGRPVIIIAVPLYATGTREIIGVVRTAMRLISPRDVLAAVQVGKTGEVDLLFPNRQVLDPLGRIQEWSQSTVDNIVSSPTTNIMQIRMDDGNIHMSSQSPVTTSNPVLEPVIASLGWRVVVSMEPAEVLGPVNAAGLTNTLISLGILIVAVLMALAITQYFTGPITRLTATAEQVRAGDLRSQAKVESQDEIGMLAQTFNQMTAQLSSQINTLEQSVAERTQDLEKQALRLRAAAEVARDAASAPDLSELLERASRLICDRFNFYHAGIFLLDDNREYAVLRASPTEAGKEMMARNHRLRVGEQGIVGSVAATGEPRIALDTGADSVYFSNPLLPATRSEMALPLKSAKGVIGVIDVQSNQPEAFTQDDIAIIQVMADQLATAIEKTRLLQQVENNLKELENAYSKFTESSWKTITGTGRITPGYRYNNVRLEAIHEVPNEAAQTLEKGVAVISDSKPDAGFASIPIRLRGQTIGVVNVRFQGRHTPQETINMIEQSADRLASALENARLVEETRQRGQRDALVSEMTGRLRSTLDVETVLRTAVQELQQAFQLKQAEVYLGVAKPLSDDKSLKKNKHRPQ
ncbi:MAG: GAF domain-containing protein [Chloroflexi bacterium]|nr:GAF domain-containing protein [Chloroflexota bacterium]